MDGKSGSGTGKQALKKFDEMEQLLNKIGKEQTTQKNEKQKIKNKVYKLSKAEVKDNKNREEMERLQKIGSM